MDYFFTIFVPVETRISVLQNNCNSYHFTLTMSSIAAMVSAVRTDCDRPLPAVRSIKLAERNFRRKSYNVCVYIQFLGNSLTNLRADFVYIPAGFDPAHGNGLHRLYTSSYITTTARTSNMQSSFAFVALVLNSLSPALLDNSLSLNSFSLIFVSVPCARLNWPCPQLLSARISYRIVSYRNTFRQKLKTHISGHRRTSSGAAATFLWVWRVTPVSELTYLLLCLLTYLLTEVVKVAWPLQVYDNARPPSFTTLRPWYTRSVARSVCDSRASTSNN